MLGVNETDRRHSATDYLKKSDKRQPLISKLRFVLRVKSTATFIAIKQAGLGYIPLVGLVNFLLFLFNLSDIQVPKRIHRSA